MRSKFAIGTLALGLVLAIGCAKAPTQEIDAARQAADSAKAASAPEYAPESWAAVEDAQSKLDAELKAQENAFVLTRSYDQTRTLATELKTAAEKAAADAQAGMEQARNEASQAIEQAKALREEVSQLLEHAPQGKGTTADLAALKSDATGSEASLTEAENAMNAGKFLEAKSKAEAVIQQLNGIKEQVTAAQQSTRRRA